jgi:hypothetical protein
MIDYILNDIKYFFDGLREKIERAENASTAEALQTESTAQTMEQLVKENAVLRKANAALKKRCEDLENKG